MEESGSSVDGTELFLGYKMSLGLSPEIDLPGERCSLAVIRKQMGRSFS